MEHRRLSDFEFQFYPSEWNVNNLGDTKPLSHSEMHLYSGVNTQAKTSPQRHLLVDPDLPLYPEVTSSVQFNNYNNNNNNNKNSGSPFYPEAIEMTNMKTDNEELFTEFNDFADQELPRYPDVEINDINMTSKSVKFAEHPLVMPYDPSVDTAAVVVHEDKKELVEQEDDAGEGRLMHHNVNFANGMGMVKMRRCKLSITCKKGNDYMQTPLYNSFSPLMFSLLLVGLHYTRRVNSEGIIQKLPTPSQVYSWAVMSTVWFLAARALFALRLVPQVGPDLLSNTVMFVWLFLCAMNATNFFKASHSPKSERKFFLGFSQLNGGHLMCPIRMNRMIFAGTMITWCLIVFNVILLSYLTFQTTVLDILSTDPIPESYPTARLISKCAFVVVYFYVSCTWIFPSTLELSISLLIYSELKLFRKSFSAKLSKDGEYEGGTLETDRRRFLKMVHIISAADRCLSLHHGAAFSCNIVNVCLILYCIIYYPILTGTPVAAMTYAFWLLAALADISVVCVSGILVNSEAHKVTEKLHFISLQGVSHDFTAQMMAFLNKLSNSIGLTVSNLFVIDQTVILSLGTMFVTYFLMVVQFASTSTAHSVCPCFCNCTIPVCPSISPL